MKTALSGIWTWIVEHQCYFQFQRFRANFPSQLSPTFPSCIWNFPLVSSEKQNLNFKPVVDMERDGFPLASPTQNILDE